MDGVVELHVAGFHDRAAGGAHVKRVLALGLQMLLVHGDQHGANLGKAEQAHEELGAGVHLHGHVLAAFHALAQEHVRRLVDQLVEGAVAVGGNVALAVLEDEEVLVAALASELVPQACERFVANDVDHVFSPLIP